MKERIVTQLFKGRCSDTSKHYFVPEKHSAEKNSRQRTDDQAEYRQTLCSDGTDLMTVLHKFQYSAQRISKYNCQKIVKYLFRCLKRLKYFLKLYNPFRDFSERWN